MLYIDVPSGSRKTGLTQSSHNPEEAAQVTQLFRDLQASGFQASDILICTPYQAQVAQLQKQIGDGGAKVATADQTPGGQAKVVICSLVRDSTPGFIDDEPRLLTAVSRAEEVFILVKSLTSLHSHLVLQPRASALW